jgi:hypothetical protein
LLLLASRARKTKGRKGAKMTYKNGALFFTYVHVELGRRRIIIVDESRGAGIAGRDARGRRGYSCLIPPSGSPATTTPKPPGRWSAARAKTPLQEAGPDKHGAFQALHLDDAAHFSGQGLEIKWNFICCWSFPLVLLRQRGCLLLYQPATRTRAMPRRALCGKACV